MSDPGLGRVKTLFTQPGSGLATGAGSQKPPGTSDAPPIPDSAAAAAPMITVCHVWTAPAMQEESDVSANVGCGHVFGLLLQPFWPLAMM